MKVAAGDAAPELSQDRVRLYPLCGACVPGIRVLGSGLVTKDPDLLLFNEPRWKPAKPGRLPSWLIFLNNLGFHQKRPVAQGRFVNHGAIIRELSLLGVPTPEPSWPGTGKS